MYFFLSFFFLLIGGEEKEEALNGSVSAGNELVLASLVAPQLQLRNLFFHERRKRRAFAR